MSCLVCQINGLIQNYFLSTFSVQDTIRDVGEKDEVRALYLQGAHRLMGKIICEQKYTVGITKCYRKIQPPLAIQTWEDHSKCRR